MKVRLAVQVISASVADALQYLHESCQTVDEQDFSEVLPTVKFIRTMDSLFDILNSRNIHNKGFKSAINVFNWPDKLHFLEATKTYLMSLKTSDGRFLYQTKKHTAITGFLINIESIICLVPQILMVQQFLLTYKISQDHLELLFNAIRRAGGWNNNPNVRQFESIFKKLLVGCGVLPGKTGNVSLLDSLELTTLANSSDIVMEEDVFTNDQSFLSAHDYCSHLNVNHKHTIEQIFCYIAGWIVRKALPVIDCSLCRESLVCVDNPKDFCLNYHLLKLKNRGGLIIPSNGTVTLLLSAERGIRHLMRINTVKMWKYEQVVYSVTKELGSKDIFSLGQHILESPSGIENHFYFNLIALLVNIFFNRRLHHIAQMFNRKQNATVLRQELSKVILFKRQ